MKLYQVIIAFVVSVTALVLTSPFPVFSTVKAPVSKVEKLEALAEDMIVRLGLEFTGGYCLNGGNCGVNYISNKGEPSYTHVKCSLEDNQCAEMML